MKAVRNWLLALGIAAVGLIGGAAATTGDPLLGQDSEIAGPDEDDGSSETTGEDEKGDHGSGGEADDKGDDDASDANDTDGPGDDEDD